MSQVGSLYNTHTCMHGTPSKGAGRKQIGELTVLSFPSELELQVYSCEMICVRYAGRCYDPPLPFPFLSIQDRFADMHDEQRGAYVYLSSIRTSPPR